MENEWEDEIQLDELPNDTNKLGLVLSTPIVSGHVKQVRYYGYFPKLLNVMKKEMARKYNDNTMSLILDCKYTITREQSNYLADSNTLPEVYSLVNAPFWVMSKIKSTAHPDKTLDGTRLYLQVCFHLNLKLVHSGSLWNLVSKLKSCALFRSSCFRYYRSKRTVELRLSMILSC